MNLNHIRNILRLSKRRFSFLFIFLAILYCSDSYSQIKNEDDLKKQAEQYFENEDYNLAYKLYAQLVSLYPKDPEFNYKLGVCMLFTEPDKKKPYSYLQIATKNPADAPKDAKFYLAKTYHVNYRFDEAIKLYTEYKEIGSASSIKKLQVDREIQACKNGKRLLSNLSDLVVINKKQLNDADYFKAYDVKEIGGKLLVKPDEYKSAYDKKKKDKSVVYLPRSGERLYYSSYGEGGGNGRDIYFVNKLPNGSWSKAQILPSSINTEFDEDYPFLHPNGKTLYFSSKGHNSMGGYDVFKTTFDDATQSWSKPTNLEFPINSPDDDILFVTDSLEKMAFFSTGRYSPFGKLDVLKINTERRPMNFAVMKGTVVKEEVSQSLKSKITVKDMTNGEIVGTFQAQDNGDYNMELPNGGKFIFTVETPGIPTQSDGVQIPIAYSLKPYRQVISYDKKILKIINYFDGAISDDNYTMMIDLIEKKAKLEVNENEPYNNNLKDVVKNKNTTDENKNLNSVSTTNPTVSGNESNNTNKNVTNEQLLSIAKMDSKEASDEAIKLKQEAQDAFGLATQKTAESVAKQKEADDAITNANSIIDVSKKNEELTKANQLKEDAKIASGVANIATNLAKKLEVDASIQQKEADLTNQYINELQSVIKNKNNKEALTKLESIQKELDDLSKQKNQSDELFTSLKAESELKQQELIFSEKKNNSIVNEINAIKNESENLEKDLANENDKSIKENISAQIRELTNEIDLKNKDLATNNKKIETLKNEVEGVNQELQIAAKILNESTEGIAVKSNSNPNSNAALNTTTISPIENNNKSTLSYEAISSKYTNKINSTAIDKTNKDEVAKQSDILKTYNKEVTDLIALDKNELSKTKDATIKKTLSDEIKNLERQKTENDKAIATNNTTIKQLESNAVAINNSNNAVNNNTTAITTTNTSNTNSVTNSAVTANSNSNNNATNKITNTSETLITEAEKLSTTASEQRKEATTKTGTEKDALIKQALENETLAINKKLAAALIDQKDNNVKFESNNSNLAELQKINGNKTSTEISQANTFINEASVSFNQAQKIRTEADANPSAAAKLGGLSNAQEKENEALTKQEKALEILSKANPGYTSTVTNTETKQTDPIANNTATVSNTSNNINNRSNNNTASNEPTNTTNVATSNETIKPISTNAGTNNSTFLNELGNLKKGLSENSSISKQVFNYNPYLEATSNALKQLADQKFDAAKQSELNLNSLISSTESSIKNSTTANPETLINEAETLNNKAYELRKESATKTGTEKAALITEATENEKLSTDKKLEASVIAQKQNKAKFENNSGNLTELQKLNGTKTSNEISQANLLVDEAAINFKQAQKMRTEAEAYPSGAAKLGGLSNAEEKENEALAKQQKALAVLSKTNPAYQVKTLNAGSSSADAIANVNNEITKTSQLQIDAYLALSKVNQNELKLQSDKLVKNPGFKTVGNNQALDLKTASDNLNNEAKAFIGQSLTAQTASEKANLLLKANEKEIAAIKTLVQATDVINGKSETIVANNTATTNTVNTNAANTGTATSTNSTTATNLNSVIANNEAINNNATNANSVVTNNESNAANTNSVATNNETSNNNATNTNKVAASNESAINNSNSANITENGVGDETSKLKNNLNNSNETALVNYSNYTNNEAIVLKDKASEKINAALTQDKQLITALDNVNQLASTNTAGTSLSQESISSITNEADKLNDEAFALRKSAAAKTGAEKDKDLNDAKALEANAIGKKINAADKQKQLNAATYKANKQSLEELAVLAKGKNISELSTADALTNEANQFLTQSKKIRDEANAYPSDAAKLGGYSNAEEKEFQALFKQQALLDIYKKHFPDYVAKKANIATDSPEAIAKLNETKTSLNTNNQAHIEGLNLLVQANEKEYKNRFISLPTTLNAAQTNLKTKAQVGYKKNQDLLTQANLATDLITKKNLLIDATKSGQEAISSLSQITNANAVIANNNQNATNNGTANNNTASNNNQNTTNNNSANNNSTNNQNTTNNNTANNNTTAITKIKVEGLEVKTDNAYTVEKPIPLDEKIPDGLVFKVQIGAFKAMLPNNTFKGLTPVIAQTTPSGYIRYMAGNFEQYTSANAVKNDLRNLGYNDAFVVAYYNGKRINLNEATDKAKASGQTIETQTNTSAGLTSNANVSRNVTSTNVTTNNIINDTQPAEVTSEMEKFNGLLFTIQIGVYSKQATRSQLFNLKPIYTEKLPNGLYRYTAGIYNQTAKLLEDKRKIVNLGVKDAFATSYYNGKRVPFAEGQKLQTENTSLKMESENPVIFSGGTVSAPTTNTTQPITNATQPTTNNTITSTVTAFSNGVTSGPAATAENGVKTDEAGISFKVQIGAYKNQIPSEVASKFSNIKTWPVNYIVINNLFIYNIGNFTGIAFAKKLKEEAVSIGISDAYITVYKDGKKLYGSEAAQYLSQ